MNLRYPGPLLNWHHAAVLKQRLLQQYQLTNSLNRWNNRRWKYDTLQAIWKREKSWISSWNAALVPWGCFERPWLTALSREDEIAFLEIYIAYSSILAMHSKISSIYTLISLFIGLSPATTASPSHSPATSPHPRHTILRSTNTPPPLPSQIIPPVGTPPGNSGGALSIAYLTCEKMHIAPCHPLPDTDTEILKVLEL